MRTGLPGGLRRLTGCFLAVSGQRGCEQGAPTLQDGACCTAHAGSGSESALRWDFSRPCGPACVRLIRSATHLLASAPQQTGQP